MPRWDYMGMPSREAGWRVWKAIIVLLLAKAILIGIETLFPGTLIVPMDDFVNDALLSSQSIDQSLSHLTHEIPQVIELILMGLMMLLLRERKIGTVLSEEGRLRPRNFIRVWPAMILVVAFSLLDLLDPAIWADGWNMPSIPAVAVSFVCFFIGAAYEEIIFRGYLRQTMFSWLSRTRLFRGDRSGRRVAAIMSTLMATAMFATAHVYDLAGLIDVFAFGLMACWLTDVSGGLEAATIIHCFSNFTNTTIFGMFPAAVESDASMFFKSSSDLGDWTLLASIATTFIIMTVATWMTSQDAREMTTAGASMGTAGTGNPEYATMGDEKAVPVTKRVIRALVAIVAVGAFSIHLILTALGIFALHFVGAPLQDPPIDTNDILICKENVSGRPFKPGDLVWLNLDEPIDGNFSFIVEIESVPGDATTINGSEVTLGEGEYTIKEKGAFSELDDTVIKEDSIVGKIVGRAFPSPTIFG